jgi:hypothetical protein
MKREDLENQIGDLCDQHGCNDKRRKIHFQQYVDRRWNPHPPLEWRLWWGKHPESDSVPAVAAYNSQCYRLQWHIAKLANLTPAQAARVETTPRNSNPAILAAHASWLVQRGRMKKEDVVGFLHDPVAELFDAIRTNKAIRPLLERMGVFNEPPNLTQKGMVF